jgi:hypothetical protein
MQVVLRQLVAPLVGLLLMGSAAGAQQPAPETDKAPAAAPSVPVSLDRIREALAQAPPAEPLKGLNEQPTFRLQIQERQKINQLMDSIKFDGGGGPEVAGGRANYEMQRLLFPPVDNPLFQPYAAFNTGEVLTLAAEALIAKLVAQKVSRIFGGMLRAQDEREAREEVARSLAAFVAAHPYASPKN